MGEVLVRWIFMAWSLGIIDKKISWWGFQKDGILGLLLVDGIPDDGLL